MMAVPVAVGPTFSVGRPTRLFEGAYATNTPARGYDVTPDGQRFVMVQEKERPPVTITQMILVENWFEELKAKVTVSGP